MSLIKRKTQNILACSLAALTAVTTAMPVYAAQNSAGSKTADVQYYNDLDKTTGSGVNGKDKDQGQQSTYKEKEEGTYSSEVYASQNSKYTVTLPKVVVLNGEANANKIYSGDYTIKVEGDIAGTKTINVDPFYSLTNTAADHFVMSQTNKDDIKATVNQTKTAFGANDLSNENQTATTIGTVNAKDLTAGSWKGKFYFDVNLNEPNAYYSTLALAIQDINSDTINTDTSVADSQTAQGAACGVYRESDNVYRIEIYKDIDNQESITINKNVKMDLNDHTITLADGNYLTYTKDFSIYDGILNSTDSNYTIFGTKDNLDSTFNINDITINQTVSENITTNSYAVDTSSKDINIANYNVNSTGSGNSSYNVNGLIVRNADGTVNLKKYKMISNVNNSNRVTGSQLSGNLISVDSPYIKLSGVCDKLGIRFHDSNIVELNNEYVYVTSNRINNSDGDSNSAGILIKNIQKININKNSKNGYIHGGNSGISCQNNVGELNIYNGYFCSPNHGGFYFSANSDSIMNIYGGIFYNTQFYNTKYDKIERPSGISGFGAAYAYSDSGTINIENATFIGGGTGIRIKSYNSGTSTTINVKNSYVEGYDQAFSIDAGTFNINENVKIKYIKSNGQPIQKNGGTVNDPYSILK